jgi:hypothetical protein
LREIAISAILPRQIRRIEVHFRRSRQEFLANPAVAELARVRAIADDLKSGDFSYRQELLSLRISAAVAIG